MPSLLWASPPSCPGPYSRSAHRGAASVWPASSEFTLDTKLLKHWLCSVDGDGEEDLGSVEIGDPCRLGGEEPRRLAVSASLCAPSSDLTGRAVLPAPLGSDLLFLFLLKLPLSNIFSQLGSRVQ